MFRYRMTGIKFFIKKYVIKYSDYIEVDVSKLGKPSSWKILKEITNDT